MSSALPDASAVELDSIHRVRLGVHDVCAFRLPSGGTTTPRHRCDALNNRNDREASARQCEWAEEVNLTGCWVASELAGVLLRGNLRRVTCLNLEGNVTEVSPATILQLAAGLEALSELQLPGPDTFTHTSGFYISLARARPSLKNIYFGEENSANLDDACVAAICHHLALEQLMIEDNKILTAGVVDIILGSPLAQTISDMCFYHVDALTTANVLRLARGCPKLDELCWYADGLTPLSDNNGQNIDALTDLLESRGKQSSEETCYDFEVFADYGPWKANSYHYQNHHPRAQHPPSH